MFKHEWNNMLSIENKSGVYHCKPNYIVFYKNNIRTGEQYLCFISRIKLPITCWIKVFWEES